MAKQMMTLPSVLPLPAPDSLNLNLLCGNLTNPIINQSFSIQNFNVQLRSAAYFTPLCSSSLKVRVVLLRKGEGARCLVDTSSSADCCLTLSSAAWLLIGPEASTRRRPSDQIQMCGMREDNSKLDGPCFT